MHLLKLPLWCLQVSILAFGITKWWFVNQYRKHHKSACGARFYIPRNFTIPIKHEILNQDSSCAYMYVYTYIVTPARDLTALYVAAHLRPNWWGWTNENELFPFIFKCKSSHLWRNSLFAETITNFETKWRLFDWSIFASLYTISLCSLFSNSSTIAYEFRESVDEQVNITADNAKVKFGCWNSRFVLSM